MNANHKMSSASKIVPMTEKKCTKCLTVKSLSEFYVSIQVRSECKRCTIEHNKKKQKPYHEKYATKESKVKKNEYQRDYYSRNKEKMKLQRDTFGENHPGYYKEYARKNKQKQEITPENIVVPLMELA